MKHYYEIIWEFDNLEYAFNMCANSEFDAAARFYELYFEYGRIISINLLY